VTAIPTDHDASFVRIDDQNVCVVLENVPAASVGVRQSSAITPALGTLVAVSIRKTQITAQVAAF
jgi:hypothetical protein